MDYGSRFNHVNEILELCFELIREELDPDYQVTFVSVWNHFKLVFLKDGCRVLGLLITNLYYRDGRSPELYFLTAGGEEFIVDLGDPGFGGVVRDLLGDPLRIL